MKSIILLSSLLLLVFLGCSEREDEITTPPYVGVHPEGFGNPSSPEFHKFVFRNNDWSFNLTECQKCHAADYNGGTVGVSCLGCHTQEAGPEACNTCHGVFADPNFIAPPNDLSDNSDKGSRGVGAHTAHVYENSIASNIGCFECHQQTDSAEPFVHAHIGPPPAKMEFGEFAYPDTSFGSPDYDVNNITCSNTYCHGAFNFNGIQGNNNTVTWNSTTGKEAECGTCHGEVDMDGNMVTPKPTGHFGSWTINQCFMCHPSVVNADGEIIDKLKHINKEADF